MGNTSSSRNPAPSKVIGTTIVVLREPALALVAASASARMDSARPVSVCKIRAPFVTGDLGDFGQVGEFVTPVEFSQIRESLPGRPARLSRRRQRSGDPLESPATADLGGGLKRLGRCGARAALQHDEIEVAGQRVPEIGRFSAAFTLTTRSGAKKSPTPSPTDATTGSTSASWNPASSNSNASNGMNAASPISPR